MKAKHILVAALILSSTLSTAATALASAPTLLRKAWKSNLVAGQVEGTYPLDATVEPTGDLTEGTTDESEEMILDTGLVIAEEQGADESLTIEGSEESTPVDEMVEIPIVVDEPDGSETDPITTPNEAEVKSADNE